jgi:hypothetical protein
MSEEINDMVGDLIDQLQATNKEANQISRAEPSVNKDNLEDYIIRKSSALIEGTIDMVDTVRDYIISAPESKDVASLAELVNAATNAVETLNKIALSNKKHTTAVKIKEMDIASKREMQEADTNTKLLLTREEVFKKLISNAQPIEAELIENKQID